MSLIARERNMHTAELQEAVATQYLRMNLGSAGLQMWAW